MRRIVVSLVLIATAVGVAEAQQGAATIDPGMSKSQVVERLGAPAAERSRGEHTYLFFRNGCERQCGMADLVTLHADTVVDAIFRSPERHYSGLSSSPTPRTPERARVAQGSAPLAVPVRAADAGTPQPARAEPALNAELAALLGETGSAPAASASAPAAVQEPVRAQPALSAELAALLGEPGSAPPTATPAPAASQTVRADPAAAAASRPASAASGDLSAELAELLGQPVPAGTAPAVQGTPVRNASAAPANAPPADLASEIAALLGEPVPAAPANAASTTPAEPVRALPSPDTIKGSPAAEPTRDAGRSTWPPPRVKSASDTAKPAAPTSEPAARADSTAQKKPAARSTWPPPRVQPPSDPGAAPPR